MGGCEREREREKERERKRGWEWVKKRTIIRQNWRKRIEMDIKIYKNYLDCVRMRETYWRKRKIMREERYERMRDRDSNRGEIEEYEINTEIRKKREWGNRQNGQ